MNDQPAPNAQAVLQVIRRLRSGDTVRVVAEHRGVRRTATVVMAPVNRPVVRLRELPTATVAERGRRTRWESGDP